MKQFDLCLNVCLWDELVFHSNLRISKAEKAMSFRDCLCDPKTRDSMAQGVVQSVNVVGMDIDAYERLAMLGTSDSIVAKNYLYVLVLQH